jgi:hypothetical protein
VGSAGTAIYVSDTASNLVAKLDGTSGHVLLALGSKDRSPPKSGTYDPLQLMGPRNLAVWTGADSKGAQDHIIVLEMMGPARISEWTVSLMSSHKGVGRGGGGGVVRPPEKYM